MKEPRLLGNQREDDVFEVDAERENLDAAIGKRTLMAALASQAGVRGLRTELRSASRSGDQPLSRPVRRRLQRTLARRGLSGVSVRTGSDAARLSRMLTPRPAAAPAGRALAKRELPDEPSETEAAPLSSLSFQGGRELPEEIVRLAQKILGVDLSQVVVHTDALADEAAAEIRASAFTIGPHIFFRSGRYEPDTARGRELLLHELTHAAQWMRGAIPDGPDLDVVKSSHPLEREADATASAFATAFAPNLAPKPPEKAPARTDSAAPAPRESTSLVLREGDGTEKEAEDGAVPAPTEVPEDGQDVNKIGVVSWDGEQRLKLRASDSTAADNVLAELAFNTRLQVIKQMPGDWYFVATESGQMGYVAKAYVSTNLPEPGAQMHKVKSGESAIGIAEQYFKDVADDWGQDLRFYIAVIAHINNVPIPDETDGWKQVHFQVGRLLWIPSKEFARSFIGAVNSGSISYEMADSLGVAQLIERAAQLMEDFQTACSLAQKYIPEALARHALEGIMRAIEALIMMLVVAALVMIIFTAIGALIGALAGGVGAAPGAVIGADIGMAVLHWMGIGFLVYWIGDTIVQVGSAFASFLAMVWDANGDQEKLDLAARQLAEALGLTVGKIIEALVILAAAQGVSYVMGRLGNTRFGRAMGRNFREWLAERARGKGESGKGETGKGETGKGETGSETGTADGLPQGISAEKFGEMSRLVRSRTSHLSEDIAVHGSRASGKARPDSDVDIAIRVPEGKFNEFLAERFGKPNEGSAKMRTMEHAKATGKIQAGEAGLRGLRKEIATLIGMKVDISVIRIDGPFDVGPYIPLE